MQDKVTSTEDVVSTSKVLETKDYGIFKKMKGNREADKKHYRKIKNNMIEVGNLTHEFPIVVNEYMEVVDGQHRLEALKELGWPVGYRIQEGLTLDTVRGINQAQQNWSWFDYATSFAVKGTDVQKDNYQKILALHKEFGYPKSVLMVFVNKWANAKKGYKPVNFNQGELVIPNYDRTVRLLNKYRQVSQLTTRSDSQFATAVSKIMENDTYDHDRMLHKLKVTDTIIKPMASVEDYARALEGIYNFRVAEGAKQRLY